MLSRVVGQSPKPKTKSARKIARKKAENKVEKEAEQKRKAENKVEKEAEQKRKAERKLRQETRKNNARYLNKQEILQDFYEARKYPLASIENGLFKNLREVLHRADCNFHRGYDGNIVIKSGSCGIGETHFKCMMCGLVNDNGAILSIHEFNICELCEVAGENVEFWKKNMGNFPLDKNTPAYLFKLLTEQGRWDDM
jgi:hypothetical protein